MKFQFVIFACLGFCTAQANNEKEHEFCDQSFVAISKIQGSEVSSPLDSDVVWVKGVVTADFRGEDRLSGYFIQSKEPRPRCAQKGAYFAVTFEGKRTCAKRYIEKREPKRTGTETPPEVDTGGQSGGWLA